MSFEEIWLVPDDLLSLLVHIIPLLKASLTLILLIIWSIELNWIELDQIESNWIKSNQIEMNQIESNQIKLSTISLIVSNMVNIVPDSLLDNCYLLCPLNTLCPWQVREILVTSWGWAVPSSAKLQLATTSSELGTI